MSDVDQYNSPLVTRYASERMCRIFGARRRAQTWRRLWIALADAQRRGGLDITSEQIRALEDACDDIDFQAVARYEKQSRHDVSAHLRAFADKAPAARSILHLGATSAYVADNADLIIMRDALLLVRDWLVNVIDALARFAKQHRSLPTLGFTHMQPAQVTTVGKRAALWCYDFVRDLDEIEIRLASLKLRGVKGTTGTQASFLTLFNGRHLKIDALEQAVAKRFGFAACEPITGQTYSRKIDAQVVSTLAGIAASVQKMTGDIRLLAGMKELEEPFESDQVGSSAMAYKRNPMRCERAAGLARHVISLAQSPLNTAAQQWFERTLDDSSNRRITIPEAFLAADGMLRTVTNVARGIVVYPMVISAHLDAELPFMATEEILMSGVKAGGDRSVLHEVIRRHAQKAARAVKEGGRPNDLLDRLSADPAFEGIDVRAAANPKHYVGRAPQQVDDFVRTYVTPIRRRHRKALNLSADLEV
jgi:adenylosuccinate lyase